jgi:phosphoenolpyruvate---glycerone phosphotransferase subunit DhaK
MKKIINMPGNVVDEMLRGIAKANRDVIYCEETGVIARKEKSNKVGIISGGGSGHEPSHSGYVGKGMLDAAISGNVFSSPDPERILEGIKQSDSGKGVLMIIKNYSGDFMNFTMAKDIAEMEDTEIEYVVVKDDVAVEDSSFSTGRRGIAGTVFIHKIAGAKAESGANMQEVKAIAEKAIHNVRSMGMALSSCIIPAIGKPGFIMGDDEMEVGMGIHGEPGVGISKMKTSKEIAEILVTKILEDFDKTTSIKDSEIALMINGLGSTTLMELYILNNDVQEFLEIKGINIYKTFVGNYMTALEMEGCSVTILKLDEELKEYLDAPCSAPSFRV